LPEGDGVQVDAAALRAQLRPPTGSTSLLEVSAGIYASPGSPNIDVERLETETRFHSRTENLSRVVERALRTFRSGPKSRRN
jgi:hypothetical protein